MQEEQAKTRVDTWAIVELMGHVRFGARVQETTLAGAGVLRADIPSADETSFTTQWIPPLSLYRMTACSEEAARLVTRANQAEPVHHWELPRLAAGTPPPPPPEVEIEEVEAKLEPPQTEVKPF